MGTVAQRHKLTDEHLARSLSFAQHCRTGLSLHPVGVAGGDPGGRWRSAAPLLCFPPHSPSS